MFYFIFLLFIIGIIYVSQDKNALQIINDKLKKITEQEINNQNQEQEKKQQIDLLLQQLQKQNEPVDCVGSFDDWSECNIEKCDILNNMNGIGKKTRKYIIREFPKNGGKICPSDEITECIKENYEFCKECKGSWGIESDCQNVTECNKTTGKGEKNQNYISSNPLANCIMPRTLKVDCSIINYPACVCSYDISSNNTCNDNNTICEGGISKCTLNYIKTPEITGGICPDPNNIYNIQGDQRCNCTVERTFGNWNYIDERCNSTTYSGIRTRIVTVRKTGGLKGCTFIKRQNEDSEDKFKHPNGNFQFSPDNDNINATFNITETENINWPNNDKCICEGTTWVDTTVCPSRTNYNILYDNFYKVQKKTTTKTIPGMTCESRQVLCPRDCSGNWNDWTVCNNQGKKTRTFRTLFPLYNNGEICPSEETVNCPFNCVGSFDDWSECNIEKCDKSNNINGIGTKTRKYNIKEYPKNLGDICPSNETTECIKENYKFCTQCKGEWSSLISECQNVTRCDKTSGIGVKSQSYISTEPLDNCVLPETRKIDCTVPNYSTCTCSYDISSNNTCNDSNTICEGGVSKCTLNYTKTPEITGGICLAPNNIYNIPGDQRCECTVSRSYQNWNYTNEKCNSTTYSANRSRIVTIKKTGGFRGCTFPKKENESIIDNTKGIFLNDKFQFDPENDKINATFDVKETEKTENWPNNDKCICEGTTWVDNTICPSRTNYNIPESNFYKVQKRTTTKTIEGITCESRQVLCPRDCSGNWNDWTICNNQGIKTRTFRTLFPLYNNGAICPSEETADCPAPIFTTSSSSNCTGNPIVCKFYPGNNYTFTVNKHSYYDILLVGGGGGGAIGNDLGGGGGGGGGDVTEILNHRLKPGTYTINVGLGGSGISNLYGMCYGIGMNGSGNNGTPSSITSNNVLGFVNLYAAGGGGGGGGSIYSNYVPTTPVVGDLNTTIPDTTIKNYSSGGGGGGGGYGNGVSGNGSNTKGYGGGGAAAPPLGNADSNGNGGEGIYSSITNSYYGGGGGGSGAVNISARKVGKHGGGNGSQTSGDDGTPYTGGGGGGGVKCHSSGNGGSGIVIIRPSIL